MLDTQYYLYILECQDGSLYTGISTNPERRLKEHIEGTGAKYTRTHKPVKIIYLELLRNRSEASKREYEIKQLSRKEKLDLIAEYTKSASKLGI